MPDGWAVIIEKHVVPLNDRKAHVTDIHCWCMPTMDHEDERLFVHHAADNRERWEGLTVQ